MVVPISSFLHLLRNFFILLCSTVAVFILWFKCALSLPPVVLRLYIFLPVNFSTEKDIEEVKT